MIFTSRDYFEWNDNYVYYIQADEQLLPWGRIGVFSH